MYIDHPLLAFHIFRLFKNMKEPSFLDWVASGKAAARCLFHQPIINFINFIILITITITDIIIINIILISLILGKVKKKTNEC